MQTCNRVVPLLAVCLKALLVHGVLPESMISVILVPVIKDKTGKINSKDNYRPIALASMLSKVLEYIILDRIEMYLVTHDNQYGSKRKHGTDLCIYVLKEIIMRYRKLNSSVFLCFLDASKAFDRVNHEKLFVKLADRGIYLATCCECWPTGTPSKLCWYGGVMYTPTDFMWEMVSDREGYYHLFSLICTWMSYHVG